MDADCAGAGVGLAEYLLVKRSLSVGVRSVIVCIAWKWKVCWELCCAVLSTLMRFGEVLRGGFVWVAGFYTVSILF